MYVHVYVYVWLRAHLGRVAAQLEARHKALTQRGQSQHRDGRSRAADGLQDLARARARDAHLGLEQVACGAGAERADAASDEGQKRGGGGLGA